MPKMVRPHFGPPRFNKPRPYSDGYNNMPHEEHYEPHPRSQRGFRGHPGKAPPSWRDTRGRGRGRPHFDKRPPLMGERRERPFNQWRSQNQDSFHSYPSQMEPHHGHRRPSPSRPNRPPPAQHRSSPHTSPAQGSPGQRGAPFHGHHSGHRSPSPSHYHGQPPDRRPASTPPSQGPFRGLHRRPSPSHDEERSWGPCRYPSPRERQFERPVRGGGRGGGRWNGRGAFSHPHNGERGPSGSPQRKPREFHGRGSYPERWPAERDPRKQHGEVGREGSGRRNAEWAHEGSPHHPPYRAPTWKGGPSPSSSFYQNSPQERPGGPPRKRKFQEGGMPPPDPDLEHDHPKHPRRDVPPVFNAPRGFGGRPLSLRDKSRIVKGRKMRAESVLRVKAPPPRPRGTEVKSQQEEGQHTAREDARATILAQRKERFQANAGPQSKDVKRPTKRQSPPNKDANTSKSSRDSETVKEQVESRRSLSTHSPSPIDRRLTRDLVVVSQWQAPPNSSSKEDVFPRDKAPKNKTERHFNSDGQLTLNERFSKMHDSSTSQREQRGRYPKTKMQRLMDMPEQNHRPGRPFNRPGPSQRPNFHPGGPNCKPAPRGPAPEPPGQFRKPLMGGFVPRPFSQKPGFKKSQSIMSKYRNMQTQRQRVPYNNDNDDDDNSNNNNNNNRGSNYRRW